MNTGLNRMICAILADHNFGNIASNSKVEAKTITVTVAEDALKTIKEYLSAGYSIGFSVLSAEGAYGNGYSYSAVTETITSGGNTITFKSSAMNPSNAAHSIVIRFKVGVFASK